MRVSTSCRPVKTRTGNCESEARISASTCSPSITGKFKSRIVRSGISLRKSCKASAPFASAAHAMAVGLKTSGKKHHQSRIVFGNQ